LLCGLEGGLAGRLLGRLLRLINTKGTRKRAEAGHEHKLHRNLGKRQFARGVPALPWEQRMWVLP
jgi:hypothetical protein